MAPDHTPVLSCHTPVVSHAFYVTHTSSLTPVLSCHTPFLFHVWPQHTRQPTRSHRPHRPTRTCPPGATGHPDTRCHQPDTPRPSHQPQRLIKSRQPHRLTRSHKPHRCLKDPVVVTRDRLLHRPISNHTCYMYPTEPSVAQTHGRHLLHRPSIHSDLSATRTHQNSASQTHKETLTTRTQQEPHAAQTNQEPTASHTHHE